MQNTNFTAAKVYRDRSFTLYLKDVARFPLLTVEEERELGMRLKSGDRQAQQKMIESNLRFVIKVARRFARRPDQLLELVNVGNLGLIEAARRFDPDRKVRFTSYAVWWIRQAIFHHLAGNMHAFRVSPKIATVLYRSARVMHHLPIGNELIDRDQLAEKIGVSLKDLNTALDTISATVSLDQPLYEDGNATLANSIPCSGALSPEREVMMERLRTSIDQLIGQLTTKEQSVIRMRYGLNENPPMTLDGVGYRLKLSRERIRQIEKEALRKLRSMQSSMSVSRYLN